MIARNLVWGAIASGIAFQFYVTAAQIGKLTGFFFWALVPYALLAVLVVRMKKHFKLVLGAAVALVVDYYTFQAVFIDPKSSTAALALIWMPFWTVIFFIPAAILFGWVLEKSWEPDHEAR